MPITEIIELIALGIATGVLGGYLGIGGAALIIPVFLELLKQEVADDAMRFKLAFGSSLLAILGSAASATISYSKMDRIHWRAVKFTAISALIFSIAGSTLAAQSPAISLQLIFALFAVINAGMLLSPLKIHADGNQDPSAMKFIVIGMFTGLVSAYIGVAGGIIMVPLFMFWSRLSAEEAPGTSMAVGVITSLAGTAGYVLNGWNVAGLPAGAFGYVLPAFSLPVLIGAVAGAPIGSRLNKKFGSSVFRKVFAFFLLAIAMKILFAP
jgi:uncharacterized membrane protein YfcA